MFPDLKLELSGEPLHPQSGFHKNLYAFFYGTDPCIFRVQNSASLKSQLFNEDRTTLCFHS